MQQPLQQPGQVREEISFASEDQDVAATFDLGFDIEENNEVILLDYVAQVIF